MSSRSGPAIRTAVVFTALALGFACVYALAVAMARAGMLPFSMEHEGFGRTSFMDSVVWLVFSNFGPALALLAAAAWHGDRARIPVHGICGSAPRPERMSCAPDAGAATLEGNSTRPHFGLGG